MNNHLSANTQNSNDSSSKLSNNHYPTIEALLPHSAPMILIDRIINIGQDDVHCQIDIDPHHIFFDAKTNTIPAYVGIEFMAQTIGIWSGYNAFRQDKTPPLGFLLGSRRYQANVPHFLKDQILDIYAEKVLEDSGMAVFKVVIKQDKQEIAQTQLNVYVPSPEKLQAMKNQG